MQVANYNYYSTAQRGGGVCEYFSLLLLIYAALLYSTLLTLDDPFPLLDHVPLMKEFEVMFQDETV